MRNISESAKLIAEFMEFPLYGKGYYCELDSGFKIDTVRTTAEMEFLSNWNWLMPVIEKISTYKFDDGDFAYPRTFGMKDENGLSMFRFNRYCLFSNESLIIAAHDAVVDFIEWHNSESQIKGA